MEIAALNIRLSNVDLRILEDAVVAHIKHEKPKLGDLDDMKRMLTRIKALRAMWADLMDAYNQHDLVTIQFTEP